MMTSCRMSARGGSAELSAVSAVSSGAADVRRSAGGHGLSPLLRPDRPLQPSALNSRAQTASSRTINTNSLRSAEGRCRLLADSRSLSTLLCHPAGAVAKILIANALEVCRILAETLN